MASPKKNSIQTIQITIALLGTNEEKKYLISNAISNSTQTTYSKLKKPTSLFFPSSSTSNESIHIVLSTSFSKKDKSDGIKIKKEVKYLQSKVRFVHGFVMVLNGKELDVKNYDIVLVR